jgi:hypothetical protein
METGKTYKVIACTVFFREICHCASISKTILDLTFLSQRLHNLGGDKLRAEIQKELDRTDPERHEGVMLGYGLCSNAIVDLKAPVKMIIPKTHDCIAILLGSKERYNRMFKEKPAIFYSSPGWVERGTVYAGDGDRVSQYEQMVKKYGEKKAKRLVELTNVYYKNYTDFLHIDTKVCNPEFFRGSAKETAKEIGLEYKETDGTVDFLLRMFNLELDKDFLIVPPNTAVKASYDDEVITY